MKTALQVRSASLPRNQATTSRGVSPLSSYGDSTQLRKAYYSQHGFLHVNPIVTNLRGEIRTSLESGVGANSFSNALSASLEERHRQRSNNGINIVDLQQMPFFIEDDSDEVVYPRKDTRVVTPELTSTSEKSDFSFPSPEINTAKLCHDHSKRPFMPESTMLPFHENTIYSTNLSNHFEDKQTTECLSINDIFLEKLTLSSPLSESNELSLTGYALLDDGPESVFLPSPIKARRSLSMNDAQYKPPKTTGDSFQRSDFLRQRAVSDRDISLGNPKAVLRAHPLEVHAPSVPDLLHFSPSGSEPSCVDTTEKSGLRLAGIDIDILSSSHEDLNLMLDEFTARTFGTSKGAPEVDTAMGDSTAEAFQELLDLSLNITEFTIPHIPMPTDVQFQGFRDVELFQQLLDISLGINDSNHTPVAAPGELLDLSISITESTNSRIPMPAEILFDELRNIDPYILRDLDKPDDLEEYTHPPASGPKEEETSEGINLFQKWLDAERFEVMIEKARSAVLSIISDKRRCKVLLGCENALAQSFLNVIQMLIDLSPTNICSDDDKGTLFIALHRLAKASLLHPRCLSVEGVNITSIHPVTFGHFGDVFKGTLKEIPVCVKMLRSCLTMDLKKLSREYQKEVIMWSHTAHANVLPFYGTYYDEVRERLCLLSPWMENGNIATYLRDNPMVNRILLIGDIINGIAYLHQNNIVHGDLKAANILVTESGRACLADFGLSAKGLSEAWTHVDSSATGGGTIRWQAPELFHYTDSTNASDIYAFAGVCYEIFTGKFPFYEIPNEYLIIVKITEGQHPSRPEPFLHGLTPEIWQMMEQCWNKVPGERPPVGVIIEVISSTGVKDIRAPPNDSELALWNLRKIIHRSSDYVSIKNLEEVISWAEAH